ncbi:MAG: ribosome silencing factor [Salibacteraceae bacterium]
MNSEKLADLVVHGMREKKAEEITLLDLRDIDQAISDFFVICHAQSGRQVDAIADSVLETVKKNTGENPLNTEGKQNAEWILIDFVDVVVHVFQEKWRKHYALEELWADAKVAEAKQI